MVEKTRSVQVRFLGRDQVDARFDEGNLKTLVVEDVSGCSRFIAAVAEFVKTVRQQGRWPAVLKGTDHTGILLREFVLRASGRFDLPYRDEELCHCRAVPTEVVDRAIISGCQTVEAVARMTSAGTSCGTCKPNTEMLISYRLDERLDRHDKKRED